MSKTTAFTLFSLFNQSFGVSRSLQDCLKTASLFKNTCNDLNQAIEFDSHVGEIVSCTGRLKCPGYETFKSFTDQEPCTWQRKLCVSCFEEEDGDVKMRVQSNTLPDGCDRQ